MRTLTQRSSGARNLRSWTRCRRSDRAPPSHGIALPLPFSLTHNQTPFDPALDEVCVVPSSVVSPRRQHWLVPSEVTDCECGSFFIQWRTQLA
jgi:hypothetical protein